jgi:hypothetical protein
MNDKRFDYYTWIRVQIAEIFELQNGLWKALVDGPHELVHQLVIFLLADALPSNAKIV